MKLKRNILHVLSLFFILTVLISTVSAFEFAEDYDLTATSFSKSNNTNGLGFRIDVPAESNFVYVDDYSGEIKNDYGSGVLATYANQGNYAGDVSLMIFIEDETGDRSLIQEFLDQIDMAYTYVDNDDGLIIMQCESSSLDDSGSDLNGSDSDSNLTESDSDNSGSDSNLTSSEDSSQNLSDLDSKLNYASQNRVEDSSDLEDSNSSDSNQSDKNQSESQMPEYAAYALSEDQDQVIIILGNNLDLIKQMGEQAYFEFGIDHV